MSYNPGATARLDQSAINYSQAATSTFYASSLATGHEDDQRSLYTYASHMDADKFTKTIGNRVYNALSNVYFLPTDDTEWTRLNKQHIALLVSMGGLYAAPDEVRAILAPQEGETKRILDIGCGTGSWCCEMAREFPHCSVVGTDLAPVPVDNIDVPANCRFEIDDINLGLSHFKGQFDVVHARLIGAGLKDFRQSMKDVEECLKPGGIVLWFDGDYDMYAKDQHEYMPFATEEDHSGSWFQRIVYEMRRGAVNSGKSDIYGMAEALDAGLWDQEALDPATCKTASIYLPIGPWPQCEDTAENQAVKYVGALMRQDLMSVHRAGHAVVKRSGFTEETLQEWSKRADDEMMDGSKPMWMRMRLAWGRRRVADGSPAPALPAPSTTDRNSPLARPSPYPYFYIYQTKEESLREAEIRNRNKDLPVPPLPTVQN